MATTPRRKKPTTSQAVTRRGGGRQVSLCQVYYQYQERQRRSRQTVITTATTKEDPEFTPTTFNGEAEDRQPTLTLLKEAEEEALGSVLPTTQPEDVTQPNPKELVRVTFVVEQPPTPTIEESEASAYATVLRWLQNDAMPPRWLV